MFSWIWDALFGENVEEHDDTVGVSMADLHTITSDMLALKSAIDAAKASLATTEKNTRLFYQSIEGLLMETYDATEDNVHVSPDTDELQEMRDSLEEQRFDVLSAMVKQKDAVDTRLFHAQMQLRILEKQKKSIEASARELDDSSLRTGHVAFPAPVVSEFYTTEDQQK